MNTFERITFKPEGATRSRTIYLRNPIEINVIGSLAVTGVEVDRGGSQAGNLKVTERRHVISTLLISDRTPVVLNVKYGELEEPTESGEGQVQPKETS